MSLSFQKFSNLPELRYGFSEREDGNMRVADASAETIAARQRFLERQGLDPACAVAADLAHGTHIHVASERDAGKTIAQCDGFVTMTPNLILTVTGADCFPVYAVDPGRKVIGLIHAGWRGTTAGITSFWLEAFRSLGSNPADLVIGIGPGIGACHFEIKDDVLENFTSWPESIQRREGKIYVDLPYIIRQQFEAEGVPSSHIEESRLCTFELQDTYFSRRRDRAGELKAMMAYLCLIS